MCISSSFLLILCLDSKNLYWIMPMTDNQTITIIFVDASPDLENICILRHDWAIELVVYNCLKWSISQFSIRSRNGSFEFRRSSAEQSSKRRTLWLTLSSLESHLSSFFTFANFLELVGYCWNAITDPLRHFFDHLKWVLFDLWFQMLIINCRCTSSTIWIFKTCVSPLWSLRNNHHTIWSQGDPSPDAPLMLATVWEA